MVIILGILFAIIGLVSTIIGLGGGTFYILSMQLFNVPVLLVPVISLMCNITVSGLGATIRLIKKERVPLPLILLLIIPSMLTSYLGGNIRMEEDKFRILLNVSLFIIILIRIVLQLEMDQENARTPNKNWLLHSSTYIKLCIISATIGLLSGVIGIGGGIILGPILYIYGFSYGQIPLITSIYIFVNSLAGISAKMSNIAHWQEISPYLILPIISVLAVLIAMKFIAYKTNSKQVRNIAIFTILLITLYNIIKLI